MLYAAQPAPFILFHLGPNLVTVYQLAPLGGSIAVRDLSTA